MLHGCYVYHPHTQMGRLRLQGCTAGRGELGLHVPLRARTEATHCPQGGGAVPTKKLASLASLRLLICLPCREGEGASEMSRGPGARERGTWNNYYFLSFKLFTF